MGSLWLDEYVSTKWFCQNSHEHGVSPFYENREKPQPKDGFLDHRSSRGSASRLFIDFLRTSYGSYIRNGANYIISFQWATSINEDHLQGQNNIFFLKDGLLAGYFGDVSRCSSVATSKQN